MISLFLFSFYQNFIKWIASFRICLSNSLNYKFNLVLMLVLPVLVFFFIKYNLWKSIYEVNSYKEIQGYTLSRMIEYQFWILIFDLFIRSYFFSENISSHIRLGKISSFLLYPFNFIAYQLSLFLSDKLIQFFIAMFCFVLALSAGWVNVPVLSHFLKAVVLIGMICMFWFFVQLILGFLSFWLEETWSLNVAIRFISAFFSGSILPLELFPKPLAEFLLWTPFPYLVYFPIQILMGQKLPLGREFSFGFCVMVLAFWLCVCFFLMKWIWKKGLNLYTGAGI